MKERPASDRSWMWQPGYRGVERTSFRAAGCANQRPSGSGEGRSAMVVATGIVNYQLSSRVHSFIICDVAPE
jgi:hypothetical protein